MEILPGFFHVAADAEGFHIADEPGILGNGSFFIRQLRVAVQAFVFYYFFLRIQLPVRVVHPVAFNIVASKADAGFGFVRRTSQEFLIL